MAKLHAPVDRTEWGMTPQTVNAYFNPLNNEIVFPAAILQPPFFNVEAEDAVNLIKKGMEINPYYSWDYLYNLGRANYALARFDEAKQYLLQAIERNQASGVNRVFLIASLVQLGELDDAEWEIMQLETSHPQYSLSNLSQVLPITDQMLRDRLNDDLRTAGMAE